VESAEMQPAWFAVGDLSFERTWQDNAHWLPRILAEERVRAVFTFKDDSETIDHLRMEAWDSKSRREDEVRWERRI
jgi:hypothetical protein